MNTQAICAIATPPGSSALGIIRISGKNLKNLTKQIFSKDLEDRKAILVSVIGWLGCQVDSLLGAILENRGLMTKGTVNAAAITSGIIAMWLYLGSPHL